MLSSRWLAVIFVPAAGLLALIAIGGAAGHLDFRSLMADATTLGRLSPFAGAMSNLGVLLWWTAVSICLFSAAIVRGRGDAGEFGFLLSAGALTAYVALDDLFRIHETVAPRHAGVPEEAIYAALGLAVGLHLFVYRRLIRRTDCRLLLAALVLLAASTVMDTIFNPWLRTLGHWEFFLEDGAKWLGIVSWCAYYTSASLQLVGAALPVTRPRAPVIEWKPGGIEGEGEAARRRVRG